MIRLVSLVAVCYLTTIFDAHAKSICDPEVIALLKNTDQERTEETVEDKLYESFCHKQKSDGLSVFIGSDSGQMSNNTSLTEACLTKNKSYFWKASSDFLVSTLPESVQRQLVDACAPNGLQFFGFDDGSTVTVNARYQRANDGISAVNRLDVNSLSAISGDGGKITCSGNLATAKTPISADGIAATCQRNGNQSSLVVQLDAIEVGGRPISATIEFAGTKLIEISWTGPNNPGTDGNWFHCSGNDGAYLPSSGKACKEIDGCDSQGARASYCARVFGSHFELHPAGDLYRLWITSYKDEKDKTKCDDPSTDIARDICVVRRVAVRASADTKSKIAEPIEYPVQYPPAK